MPSGRVASIGVNMFLKRQSQISMKPIRQSDRKMNLKVGQVVGHSPGKNEVMVDFDGQERAPDNSENVTGDEVNTRKIPCKMGQSFSGFRSSVAGLPPKFAWVVVAFMENEEHAPVVLACIDDDFSNILQTLADDPFKRLIHHYSDTTFLIRRDGQIEFVHPTGLKMILGEPGAAFTQHIQQVRHDVTRALKGQDVDESLKGKFKDTDIEKQQYESPQGKWDDGTWDYGPPSSSRTPGDYDHRMVARAEKSYFKIMHPATGSDWKNDPGGSGGEFGANYQETETYLEWNEEGSFRFHTKEGVYVDILEEGNVLLHADDLDYFLDIDAVAEAVALSADSTDVYLLLDKGNSTVKLSGENTDVFLELDVDGDKVTLSGKAGLNHLVFDIATGIAELYSPTKVLIGDATAQPLWKFPIADQLYNAHFHLDFLGIPTTPPQVPMLPAGLHLTTIAMGT